MKCTPTMDEFSKKCIFSSGLQKWVVDTLFNFPKLLEDVARIIKMPKALKLMVPKENGATLHFKMA